jgi:hypothetical protein
MVSLHFLCIYPACKGKKIKILLYLVNSNLIMSIYDSLIKKKEEDSFRFPVLIFFRRILKILFIELDYSKACAEYISQRLATREMNTW